MPKISVIVPVYRVEPYLHRCVDSILGQSYTDFELILVDDGSPDNCGAMCDEYAEQDSRIHVIHQKNGGLSAARNAGIDWVFANSDSQWLTFVDSDDWVHKEYLQTMLTAALQHGTTQALCDMLPTDKFVEDAALSSGYVLIMNAEQAYIDHYGLCLHACGKILHRSLLTSLRFPEGKIHEDAFVTHILTFASARIAICDVPLYYYFGNPGSITRTKWTQNRLHEFEAHEIRLAYLQEHGYQKAYVSELEAYTWGMFAQIQDLKLLSKENANYQKYMKEIHAKAMPRFREARKYGLFPYSASNVWIYELAYPIKPIWILRNVFKSLFH